MYVACFVNFLSQLFALTLLFPLFLIFKARERESYYRVPTFKGRTLPLRILPPESLNENKFTKESDVWMFGCLCWEVISGTEPFHNIIDPLKVVEAVRAGATLQKEFDLYSRLYSKKFVQLMKSCQESSYADRPSFQKIHEELQNIL
jgi:hypothetical protein